jgi:hypothetical protein
VKADRTDVRRFYQLAGPTPLSGKMRQALENERGVSFADASDLRMLAKAGQIGDRPVTYFRIFDPASILSSAGDVRDYDDIAAGVLFCSGHIEGDNTIVLTGEAGRT